MISFHDIVILALAYWGFCALLILFFKTILP